MRVKENRVQGPTCVWLLDQIERFFTINKLDNDGCLFGWHLCRDRSLVERLRDGGDVTTSKMDEILAFMQDPVRVIRTGSRGGDIRQFTLKPMKIKPKELP